MIPEVTIIGAGPSGLLLARYLELHCVPAVIYERDSSPETAQQGGTLDLHADTGLRALKRTGLLDLAEAKMRPEGEAWRVLDSSGEVFFDEVPGYDGEMWAGGGSRPEIDRRDLRAILLSSLRPGTVKWGHALQSARAVTHDMYELTFKTDSGTRTVQTGILVGADGTFSRVRPLLHAHTPDYAGITMFELSIPSERMSTELKRLVGPGGAMIFGQLSSGAYAGIMPQMNAGGRCKVYADLRVPLSWLDENPLPEKDKRDYVKTLFEGWDERVLALLDAADEEVVARRIYQFEPEVRWESALSGVTVMGDAAHVMSPFAGEGVNQALADGLLLGETLVSVLKPTNPPTHPFPLTFLPLAQPTSDAPIPVVDPPRATLHAALRKFEKAMMDRARPEMRSSKENLEIAFGPDAARKFGRMFSGLWMMGVLLAPLEWVRRVF